MPSHAKQSFAFSAAPTSGSFTFHDASEGDSGACQWNDSAATAAGLINALLAGGHAGAGSGGPVNDGTTILWTDDLTVPVDLLSITNNSLSRPVAAGALGIARTRTGVAPVNAVKTVDCGDGTTGTFDLTGANGTAQDVPVTANQTQMQTAADTACGGSGGSVVVVTGSAPTWTFTWTETGGDSRGPQASLVVDDFQSLDGSNPSTTDVTAGVFGVIEQQTVTVPSGTNDGSWATTGCSGAAWNSSAINVASHCVGDFAGCTSADGGPWVLDGAGFGPKSLMTETVNTLTKPGAVTVTPTQVDPGGVATDGLPMALFQRMVA